MTDYSAVKKALESGADPAMLCATCPWDRNCATPPQMTAQDVDDRIREAQAKDAAPDTGAPAGAGRFPAATLMTTLVFAGRDTALAACPVLAARFRSGDGRKIAEGLKNLMQSWKDD